jgi:hypothetical protein
MQRTLDKWEVVFESDGEMVDFVNVTGGTVQILDFIEQGVQGEENIIWDLRFLGID